MSNFTTYFKKGASACKKAFAYAKALIIFIKAFYYSKTNNGFYDVSFTKIGRKWYCNVPVMFATAVTEKSIVEKCLSQHPQGYLIKPLGKEELLEVVNKFFASNQ